MCVNRPLRSTQQAASPASLQSASRQGAPGPAAVEQGLLPAGPGQVGRLGPAYGHCIAGQGAGGGLAQGRGLLKCLLMAGK